MTKGERKKQILIVDNEKDFVAVMRMRLKAQGYETEVAYDGKEALEKAQKTRPDLILLDVLMPKVNGYKVCEALKNSGTTRDIPVIVVTARAQGIDKILSSQCRADAYITKPFDTKALMRSIENYLHAGHVSN